MAGPQTALTWRKFPRDMISRPEVQFIAKRLAPEKRHTIFTVITALYCQADDFGYIDLDDPELFTDMCMLDSETELFDLLDRLVARKLVELPAPRFYKIVEWTEPYETIAPPPAAQASLRRRREQIAERILNAQEANENARENARENPPDRPAVDPPALARPAPAVPAAPEPAGAPGQNENDKIAENVTLENLIDKSTKNADLSIERERERDREIDIYNTHTHKKKSGHRKRATRRAAPDEHSTDEAHSESERKPPTEQEERTAVTDTTAPKAPGEATGPEAYTEMHDSTDEPGNGQDTGQGAYTRASEDTGQEDDEVLTKEWAYIPESAPPAGAWVGPYEALEKSFLHEWPMGFPNEKREKEALVVLSARISMLGSKKNDAEVVACQFVGAFANMIRKGGYYEGMNLLPSMLLKPGNYAKVFAKVQSILHPKQDYSSSWAESWKKAVQEAEKDAETHDPTEATRLLYAKYGIRDDDPDRFQKLYAKKREEAVS